jgi:IAA-amino acid hydrolase
LLQNQATSDSLWVNLQVILQQAAVLRCTAEVFFDLGRLSTPPVINEKNAYEHMRKVATETLGEENVLLLQSPLMASEDFAYYLGEIPGAMQLIGVDYPSNRSKAGMVHSPEFFPDEDALPVGAALHANIAISYLEMAAANQKEHATS